LIQFGGVHGTGFDIQACTSLRGGDVMTMGKTMALAFGLVGGFALGVWTGPHLMQRADRNESAVHQTVAVPEAEHPRDAILEAKQARAARAAAARTAHVNVNVDAPALHERLKPVLNHGANMTVAAEGFRSAEQFAMVAHAARNTEVPFLLLKHRVLNEGKSLADAIRESKPAADAAAEAKQARSQARADLESIAG
jgi:hypothetical protein